MVKGQGDKRRRGKDSRAYLSQPHHANLVPGNEYEIHRKDAKNAKNIQSLFLSALSAFAVRVNFF